jgi:hypothetical protein
MIFLDAWLVVFLFQFAVSLTHALLKYAATHSSRTRARSLDAELQQERARAHSLNSPDTFVEYAKATRRINRLEKDLAALQHAASTSAASRWLARFQRVQMLTRLLVIVWFWNIPMFVFDQDFFWPASYWLRSPGWPSDSLGVVAWTTICTAVSNTILLQP